MDEVVIGIDVGTQGARVLAVSPRGGVISSAEEKFDVAPRQLPAGWFEQDALGWWQAVSAGLRRTITGLPAGAQVSGLAVDSTSGTLLAVDASGSPLHPALMYNDSRSHALVAEVRQAARELEAKLGYAFGASFGLPKILWLMRERPDIAARAARFIHATDFIVGRLTGEYGITNSSDALKSGYDLIDGAWPAFIERDLGVPLAKLPAVVAPGTFVSRVSGQAAAETGLARGTPVYGGATDGTAAQIASGAVEPGAWNTSLGTTLVVKGITRALLLDPLGRIYSHRHPEGWWMPGGASNTGAEWIVREHPGRDLKQLDAAAAERLPTRLVRYPLARTGERFPFVRPQASGFTAAAHADAVLDEVEAFAAGLEGTAMLERLAYDTLSGIGAAVGDRIHATGGSARSEVWLRIRASVLKRTLVRPRVSETAMGAAMLAASGCWFGSLTRAAQAMAQADLLVEPDAPLSSAYEEKYQRFLEELGRRGYI